MANASEKEEYLAQLSRSYLYKDILDLSGIRYGNKLRDLLRLLAYQTGSLVSFSELGRSLGLTTDTVQRYVDLLEQSFVVFRLTGFSRNLRKEIVKNPKVYFYDLGIRNAVLENFNPPDKRQDRGGLWENFLLLERIKAQSYRQQRPNRFFWRTYTGAEIDYVEESGGNLRGYAFKGQARRAKAPATWSDTYPQAVFASVHRENYLDFILAEDNRSSAPSSLP